MGRPPKSDLSPKLVKLLQQIGANIAAIRRDQNLAQAELARRAKISLTTLNEIETRRFRNIRLSTLCAIAQALNVSVHQFFMVSDVDLSSRDRQQLLQASESILRITKKLND